jgi:hypothetical protein
MLTTALSLLTLATGCSDVSAATRSSLYDADASIRLEALYQMGPAEKITRLPRLIIMAEGDPISDVQYTALALLGTTGSPDAVPTLHRKLHDSSDTDGQIIAARALGALSNVEACSAMVEAWVQWIEPTTDYVALELRDSLVRSRSACQKVVRSQVREHPERLRPIMGDMTRA